MIVHLSVTGAAPGPVTALAGVGGPVVQTLPPLAGISLTASLVALLDVPAPLGHRNPGLSLGTLQDQVKDAAGEPFVSVLHLDV